MIQHQLKVYPSTEELPKENQLAWKFAKLATDKVKVNESVEEMIIKRIIDNASVAVASLNRLHVANARSQAITHHYST